MNILKGISFEIKFQQLNVTCDQATCFVIPKFKLNNRLYQSPCECCYSSYIAQYQVDNRDS